ncbi:MAG: 5-formyltetrahydrofolate cyclo-ligase [Euryarchaeota archaeon]|nr:5-formyltetrahydrofolate cyclo-ligase [Euryarchaeota archaeon]
MGVREEKQRLREHIWKKLVEAGVARFPPPYGRIPNFEGAEVAAARLSRLEEGARAGVVLANPDSPQRRVRELALRQGKVLIMASPRLRRGYLKIDPAEVRGREAVASSIKGAFRYGRRVGLDELESIDLVVTGCVAVAGSGARLGKGSGYGDREIAEVRRRWEDVPIATTVHELQVVEWVPREEHDQRVSIIATPRRVIRVLE